jgi:hypothetical protein
MTSIKSTSSETRSGVTGSRTNTFGHEKGGPRFRVFMPVAEPTATEPTVTE